jgi:peptidoglycan/xylan/chitin deacetylase (PgdA/CDA1 family)
MSVWRSLFLAVSLALAWQPVTSEAAAAKVRRPHRVLILQYHHVSNDTPAATSVRPDMFARQLDLIEQEGFHVWPLRQLLRLLRSGSQAPEDVLAITFDDAYQDFATHAWPLLQKRGWPATLFVPTGAIGDTSGIYLSWSRLRQLRQQGVELESHGHGHAHMAHMLRDIGAEAVLEDMRLSRRLLQEKTGASSLFFAYPYGEYSSELARLTLQEGWVPVGQHSGPPVWPRDMEALPRFPINQNTGDDPVFLERLRTLSFPTLPGWQRPDPMTGQRAPVFRVVTPLQQPIHCFASNIGPVPVLTLADQPEGQHLQVQSPRPVPGPRFRYNCTAKGPAGFHHWLSQPWVMNSQPVD